MTHRILIVDDAMFMRSMLRDIFLERGYEIAGEAGDGQSAVELYQRLRPDLVTMDIVMPEMSGIEAVRAIMAVDPAARVVMCSALGQEALVTESIEAGARDFIVKPFAPEKVIQVVEQALEPQG